eukprot:1720633-Prymnesium_polylepis.2
MLFPDPPALRELGVDGCRPRGDPAAGGSERLRVGRDMGWACSTAFLTQQNVGAKDRTVSAHD